MRIARLIVAGAALAAAAMPAGCQQRPTPGMAGAKIHVVAQPKAGTAERSFIRVPVYDAAPVRPVASGQWEQVDYSKLSNIIVWLEPQPGLTVDPPARPLQLAVNPARPSPAIQAASVSQRIRFVNRSEKPLSLYSVSDGNDFDLPSIPPGATAEYTIKASGLIEILHDPARPPLAQVYAAPTRWVARTRSNRTVTFIDVPPGRYQAVAWHPRLPGASAPVPAIADRVSLANLTLGVSALPAPTEP